WPCLFPQHGPGPKHRRPIELTDWQDRIVGAHVKRFLRGLIHSDGTRIVATERKGAYVRRAPRYAFRNRSDDILEIFRRSCELAGIYCTRASPTQIARVQQDRGCTARRVRRSEELRASLKTDRTAVAR